MKTPVDIVPGRIIGYDDRSGELIIRAHYDDIYTLFKREYNNVKVQLIDSRPLSDKQRRMCYALLREIAEYTGGGDDTTKEYMKIKFLLEDLGQTADDMFSLSNAPMSLVCAFQRFLIHFILDWDIPCSFPLLDYADDVNDYIYHCLITKKCCICGKKADLHHHSRIGNGRDREEIEQLGWPVQPLCREHHIECHTMPQAEFDEKYHIIPVKIDETLKRIYKLHGKRKTVT